MAESEPRQSPVKRPARKKYVPVVGPHLKKLLILIFALVAVLGVNSVYLVSVTILERASGQTYENYFYQLMFLGHLLLGTLLILPVIIFGIFHIYNAWNRPNKRAVRAGYALFITSLILLASGVVLTRLEGIIVVKDPGVRSIAYWAHVISPLLVVWLFILHRLAGRRIKWKVGGAWAGVAVGFACIMVVLHAQDPRKWNVIGPNEGEKYFFPSLARTATGNFIPGKVLHNDQYCIKCHADVHENWAHSMHRFSSFNNPAYLFSVKGTRKAMMARDGNVQASRWCAGCHDPVPFFSGAFDDPKFDDPNYDLANDTMAMAGITCTVCHAITNINSVKGNADFTIDEPIHYPFAFSENKLLFWINQQLVKAKPEFHKKTFLKPFHKTAEFCSTCHKVHLPPELNAYKWLRGQNHYDAYHLSGVSGHGINSFYYPPKATHNCNDCHMKLHPSDDFGAKDFDGSGVLQVHNHQFPSANTAIPHLLDMPEWVNDAHRAFNEGVMRVDIFGIKDGYTVASPLIAPIRPEVPTLKPGNKYLLETIIRTVKMGHLFTQGTADSNEIWMDVTVRAGDKVIGRSGGMRAEDGEVDPWSHFVNIYMLDRKGNRIDQRNAQDIFTPLYNHQIPPGAGDVVHYVMELPADLTTPITVDVKLQFRKFDTTYMKHFQGEEFKVNDLPIMTLATDSVTFPVEGVTAEISNAESPIVLWQRWNDYGIGLLRKGSKGSSKGELRQAEAAFAEVGKLGRPDGALNRARVYLKEGRLDEAAAALKEAAAHDPPAPAWSVAWFTGQVNKQNGHLDEAIKNYMDVVTMDTAETREREFDFSQDYTLLAELGQTLFERAKQERGDDRKAEREKMLNDAVNWLEKALVLDPELMTAHYSLSLIHDILGNDDKAAMHRALHEKYRPDDNAQDIAIAKARLDNPAANHASEDIVIYDLQRPGAFELDAMSSVKQEVASDAR